MLSAAAMHWTQTLTVESREYLSSIFLPVDQDRRRCLPKCIPPIEYADLIDGTMPKSDPTKCAHNALIPSKLVLDVRKIQEEYGEGGSMPYVTAIDSQTENYEIVGEGCFGKVLKGTYDDRQVAVKILKIPEFSKHSRSSYIEKELLINLSSELSALKYFGDSHPNLCKFKGAIAAGGCVMIVMELAERGDLRMVLQAQQKEKEEDYLTWKTKVSMGRGIANGLHAIHEVGLIHRDIKDTNVLVDANYNCMLCDHGFIVDAECESRLETCAGTQHFMAPEMELGCSFNQSADCFSLGITLCGMVASRIPGEGGFLARTPRNHFEFSNQEFREAVPRDCPPSLVDLCVRCCTYEPEARPSALEIVEWLDDMLETDFCEKM